MSLHIYFSTLIHLEIEGGNDRSLQWMFLLPFPQAKHEGVRVGGFVDDRNLRADTAEDAGTAMHMMLDFDTRADTRLMSLNPRSTRIRPMNGSTISTIASTT